MRMLLLVLVAALAFAGCGAEIKQTQGIEGDAGIRVRLEISFPECANITDEELIVRCVEAAAKVTVTITGGLSDDQKEIIDELNIDRDDE